MFKFAAIFLLLVVVIVANDASCEDENCLPSMSEMAEKVDHETRRLYWYFLRGSDMLYQSNFDTENRYLYFFIYRNIVGTFLCIASWHKNTGRITIDNLIRLGNGYSRGHQMGEPVKIEPFMIDFKLDAEEYTLQLNEFGSFQINGAFMEFQASEKDEQTHQLDNTTSAIDRHLRKQFWHYIKGAKLAQNRQIRTNLRSYVLLTYVDEVLGTYFVVSNINHQGKIEVNTFVRLGDYVQEEQEEEEAPVVFLQPEILIIT